MESRGGATPLGRQDKGFTLAEVLITLGIIGVVAAMTIPTLVQSFKKKEVETKLVRFNSIINQAIQLADVEQGSHAWAKDTYVFAAPDDPVVNTSQDTVNWFNTYLAPHLKATCNEDTISGGSGGREFLICTMNNGDKFGIDYGSNREWIYFIGDPEKCLKKENYAGSCGFYFLFRMNDVLAGNEGWKYHVNTPFAPYMYNWDGEIETLKTDSTFGCNDSTETENSGRYCTALIQQNNWKVPEDYPFKF